MYKKFTFLCCLLLSTFSLWAADIELVDVELDHYLAPGDHEVSVLIENKGSSTITSFELFWSINGTTNSYTFDNLNFPESDDVFPITLPFDINISASSDNYVLEMWVTEVNGEADDDDSDNQVSHAISRLTANVQKKVVFEKITATWCPNCPAGANLLESIIEDNPESIIDLHWHKNSDPYKIPAYDDIDDVYSPYQPRALIDRYIFPGHVATGSAIFDPAVYKTSLWQSLTAYRLPSNSAVHLATETDFSSSSRELTVDIEATFYADLLDGEYRLNCYVIEDGIVGYQSSGGDNYVHKNVVRAALGGAFGTANSLPSNIEEGDSHSYQYTYTVPDDYDEDNMHVVVVVQEYNDDEDERTNREYLNALECGFDASNELGLEAIEVGCIAAVDVPNIEAEAELLCQGETILIEALQNAPAGFEYQWQLNGLDLDGENDETLEADVAGDYSVYLVDSEGCTSQNSEVVVIIAGDLPGYDIDIDLVIPTSTVTVTADFGGNSGDNVDIEWSFGDGTYGSGPTAEHTYDEPGTYSICPTLSNDCVTIGECYLVEIPHPFELEAKVLLEGAYNANGQMNANLGDLIPKTQPYNMAPYNYDGLEQIPGIPFGMVDWVLVEARSGTPGTVEVGTQVVEVTAALLMSDGSIKDLNGTSDIGFNNLEFGEEYHFVIRHRNHLDIISANPLEAGAKMDYDFTTDIDQASGSNQLKATGDGFAVMHAGDFTHDGVIQLTDYDVWVADPAILNEYQVTDANLDSVVQLTDFDAWLPNKAKLGSVEIRY